MIPKTFYIWQICTQVCIITTHQWEGNIFSVCLPVSQSAHEQGLQWRIQDFPEVGVPSPRWMWKVIIWPIFFQKNCMKLKDFGPQGVACPWHPLRSASDLHVTVPMMSGSVNSNFTYKEIDNSYFQKKAFQ